MIVTASKSSAGAPGSLFGMYVLSLAASGVGNLLIRVGARGGWLPPWGQLTLAVVCSLPFFVAAALFWRLLRRDLDEMLQRIVLEGLAFALTVYIPLAALYVNLGTSNFWTPRLDPPDLLLAPALLVAIGIIIARKRYE